MKFMAMALLAALLGSAAHAADGYGYVGLGLGAAASDVVHENRSNRGFDDSANTDKGAGGGRIYGGFTTGRFGGELAYYDLGRYEVSGSIGGFYAKDRFQANAAAAYFVMNFMPAKDMIIHGKAGIAQVTTKYHCSDFCNSNLGDTRRTVITPTIGAGFSWAFAKNWAVRGDLDLFTGKSRVGTSNSYDKSVGYSLLSVNIEARF